MARRAESQRRLRAKQSEDRSGHGLMQRFLALISDDDRTSVADDAALVEAACSARSAMDLQYHRYRDCVDDYLRSQRTNDADADRLQARHRRSHRSWES